MAIKKSKFSIKIFFDEHPENPRKQEHIGNMVCWHNRYCLGDRHSFRNEREFLENLMKKRSIIPAQHEINMEDVEDARRKIIKILKEFMPIQPLYFFQQSSELLLFQEFAGQKGEFAGYVYVENDEVERMYQANKVEEKMDILRKIRDEVEVYSRFIRGDNYIMQILRDGEEFERISGFTGSFISVFYAMKEVAAEKLEKEGVKSKELNKLFNVDELEPIIEKKQEKVFELKNDESEEEL